MWSLSLSQDVEDRVDLLIDQGILARGLEEGVSAANDSKFTVSLVTDSSSGGRDDYESKVADLFEAEEKLAEAAPALLMPPVKPSPLNRQYSIDPVRGSVDGWCYRV
jgi:hypothetical protein